MVGVRIEIKMKVFRKTRLNGKGIVVKMEYQESFQMKNSEWSERGKKIERKNDEQRIE